MALAHITLATRDVRRSSAFFAEALGWRPIARPGNIGRPAAWLAIAPGVELHLVEDPEFEPSPFEKEFGRHIAVAFPLAEFPALQERLHRPRRHAHRPDPRHAVPAVLLPRPGRVRLRGRGRGPRRAEADRLRAGRPRDAQGCGLGVSGLAGGGGVVVGTSGLITGDARSLCTSFLTSEVPFHLPALIRLGRLHRPGEVRPGHRVRRVRSTAPLHPAASGCEHIAIARLATTDRAFTLLPNGTVMDGLLETRDVDSPARTCLHSACLIPWDRRNSYAVRSSDRQISTVARRPANRPRG